MENRNLGFVITLMGMLIVILIVLCVLFATGKISLKTCVTKDNQTTKSSNNETISNETYVTNELKEHINEAIKRMWKISYGNTYCGEHMNYSDNDAIFDEYGISTHNVSNDYNSISDMKEDLSKYISDNIIDDKLNRYEEDLKNKGLTTYIEKANKLYCYTPHKGASVYNKLNENISIDIISNDEINVGGIIIYGEPGSDYMDDRFTATFNKDDRNNWVITNFEDNYSKK